MLTIFDRNEAFHSMRSSVIFEEMTPLAENSSILVSLFVVFTAAKLLAEIFERFHQPAVIGEILAGVLVGPSVLAWASPSEVMHILAEIGVIFLLFTVGLETKPATILRVGKMAVLVAVLGMIFPLITGWAVMRWLGSSPAESWFVGTTMVATSVGITARVLSAMGVLRQESSRVILAAAVIDDILGLLVLAIVSSFSSGKIDYFQITTTVFLAIGFTAVITWVGAPVLKRVAPHVDRLRIHHASFIASLILCFGLSAAAALIGIAAIIGAFLAGMALAEVTENDQNLHKQVSGITEFLTPFFLSYIGLLLQIDLFRNASILGLAILLTFIAMLTKFIGCGLGAWNLGWKSASQVGVGMIPRGEVGIVVAQIGLSFGILSPSLFAVVLFMASATTLIAPALLKILFKKPAH